MKLKIIIIAVLIPFLSFSQNFDEYVKEYNNSFLQYKSYQDSIYNIYKTNDQKAFEEYVSQIKKNWENDLVFSSKYKYVVYSDDKKTRTIIDYKTGIVTVETLKKTTNILSAKQVLKNTLNIIGKTKPYNSIEKSINISNKPLLYGLVSENVKCKQINDNNKTKVISFKMFPNHVQVQAKKYSLLIDKYSKKYKISKSLVYAIIHTESYFNPNAKSSSGALGLMQLMPQYAARESYKRLFGKNIIPKDNFILLPKNNINMGIKYLSILEKETFKKVLNNESRTYCVIASYNCGVNNFIKTFSTYNTDDAVIKINKMNSNELYKFLLKNIPYKETRNYLKKVVSLKNKYENNTCGK